MRTSEASQGRIKGTISLTGRSTRLIRQAVVLVCYCRPLITVTASARLRQTPPTTGLTVNRTGRPV